MFHRLNRTMALSEPGETLAPGCRDAFSALSAAWASTQRLQDSTTLTITAGPAFTAKWLAPPLYEFAHAHPDIDLRFAAGLRIMDLDRDKIDIAIRFGNGPDDGLWSLSLADEWVSPVMTPELAERFPAPESLKDAILMMDQSVTFLDPPCDWAAWFRAVNMTPIEPYGPRFSQADHAVDAALAGVGVTLGHRAPVVKDINEGRLMAPYGMALNTGARLRFLCREGPQGRPHIKAFRIWILARIDKTHAVIDAMTHPTVRDHWLMQKAPNHPVGAFFQ